MAFTDNTNILNHFVAIYGTCQHNLDNMFCLRQTDKERFCRYADTFELPVHAFDWKSMTFNLLVFRLYSS